jgi:hypothetical protein
MHGPTCVFWANLTAVSLQARGAFRVAAEQLLGAKVSYKPHNPYLSPRITTGGAGSNTNLCLEADRDGGEPPRLPLPPRGAAAPGGAAHAVRGAAAKAADHGARRAPASEKDAKLAQKLGQLQPFLAALPQECMGQLASFGPT